MMSRNHVAALAVILFAVPVGAQTPRRGTRCDRIGTTTFEFGRIGGNIRGGSTKIGADGSVTRLAAEAWTPVGVTLPADAVHGLAKLAWTNGFASLPTAPARPTRNPDAARDYIDVRSACGSKHVEVANGEGPAAFRELLALLTLAVH